MKYSKKKKIRCEALQIEAARRYEIMMQEQNRIHEQLRKLFSPQPSVSQLATPLATQNILIVIKNGKVNSNEHPSCSSASLAEDRGKGLLSTPYKSFDRMEEIQGRAKFHLPYPKLDFPTFSEEPREQGSKYEQYFKTYQIHVNHWVEIATMHFIGKAHRWKDCYLIDKPNLSWEELLEAVRRRFDNNSMKQLVREFNKLVQIGIVEKYQEKFKDSL